MQRMKIFMTLLLLATLIVGGGFGYLGQKSRTMKPQVGVNQGRLMACPNKPNCITTQAASEDQQVPALSYNASLKQIMSEVRQAIKAMDGEIQSQSDIYFHVTFKSSLFGFVDDFEVFVDDANKIIHLRSASRVGHSDLGANKKRYEKFKSQLKSLR